MAVDLAGYYGAFSNRYGNLKYSYSMPMSRQREFDLPYVHKKQSKTGIIIGILTAAATIIGGVLYLKKHPISLSNIKTSFSNFWNKLFKRKPKVPLLDYKV